ncbi:hypothetical protein [Vannielia litorea]|nr:hypothetical protein [Vannielia litorea]
MLETITDHFEVSLQQREVEGDDTVAALRIQAPWLLEQLGDPFITQERLTSLRRAVRSEGHPDLDPSKRKFGWIFGFSELRREFLRHVISSDASGWSEMRSACEAIVRALEHAVLVDGPSDEEETSSGGYSALKRKLGSDPNLAQAVRAAMALLNDLRETAWPEAFRSGRILVFRKFGHTLDFYPPSQWEKGPPKKLDLEFEPVIENLMGWSDEELAGLAHFGPGPVPGSYLDAVRAQ